MLMSSMFPALPDPSKVGSGWTLPGDTPSTCRSGQTPRPGWTPRPGLPDQAKPFLSGKTHLPIAYTDMKGSFLCGRLGVHAFAEPQVLKLHGNCLFFLFQSLPETHRSTLPCSEDCRKYLGCYFLRSGLALTHNATDAAN